MYINNFQHILEIPKEAAEIHPCDLKNTKQGV